MQVVQEINVYISWFKFIHYDFAPYILRKESLQAHGPKHGSLNWEKAESGVRGKPIPPRQ